MQSSTIRFRIAACVVSTALCCTAASSQREPVTDFVRATYYHGLPAEQAAAYGREHVPELVEILQDPSEKDAWPNAVSLLGIIGDESAAAPLIEFLERFEGNVDAKTFQALTLTPAALGKVSSSADGQAIRYLMDAVEPGAWRTGRARWRFGTLTEEDRPAFMTKLAVGGLALAGTPATLERLRRLRREAPQREQKFERLVLPALDEAIVVNELLVERGRGLLRQPDFDQLVAEELRRRLPPQR